MIKHTLECSLNMDLWVRAKARYIYNYPAYCRTCNGWGGQWDQYDPSPAGSEVSPGFKIRFTLCPKCIEIGVCPRCGMTMREPDEEADTDEACPFCGYKLSDMEGIPDEPECTCDE